MARSARRYAGWHEINAIIVAGDLFMTAIAEVRKQATWAIPGLAIFLFGCATPVQELWPPPEGAPTHTIVVSLDTWHAMIAITLDERVTALDRKSVVEDGVKFYPSKHPYHLFHQCHQYAAEALREAGLPVSAWWAFSRTSFAMQLRRAARMADEAAASRAPAGM